MKKAEYIQRYGIEAYEKQLENHRKWTKKNQEWYNEYHKNIRKNGLTTIGTRIDTLICAYRLNDKLNNRGECTLTKEDMIELFKNGCHWCGETDWKKLGADRIDIKKPHTKENCVCSCRHCNCGRELKKAVQQYTKDGVLVAEYESLNEASRRTKIHCPSISLCCNNKQKTAGGYLWKFKD